MLKPLAKSILIPLGSTAAAAATDAAIHKNILVQVVILWTLLFIQTFKETGDSQYIYIYIYQNELDKAYFQCYLAYGGFKDLTRRTASDKILHHQAFNIAKNPKYDRYQRSLARMFYKFFDKKPLVAVLQMRIL